MSYATSDGTAIAGSDYTAASGTLTWASGDAADKTFAVPIINNNLVETTEALNLTLSNPTGDATLGAQATAVLTIIDAEPTDPLYAQVSSLLHFEEAALPFVDQKANNWDTTVGATSSTVQKKFGERAMFCSGANAQYIRPATNVFQDAFKFGTADFTVECWAFPTDISVKRSLCGFQNTLILQLLNITNSRLGATIRDQNGGGLTTYGGDAGAIGTVITINVWHHLAIVRVGNNIQGYLNGVQQFNAAMPSAQNLTPIGADLTFDPPFTIGSNRGLDFFSGYIDEFRVTNGVARYTANFTPPTAAFPNA